LFPQCKIHIVPHRLPITGVASSIAGWYSVNGQTCTVGHVPSVTVAASPWAEVSVARSPAWIHRLQQQSHQRVRAVHTRQCSTTDLRLSIEPIHVCSASAVHTIILLCSGTPRVNFTPDAGSRGQWFLPGPVSYDPFSWCKIGETSANVASNSPQKAPIVPNKLSVVEFGTCSSNTRTRSHACACTRASTRSCFSHQCLHAHGRVVVQVRTHIAQAVHRAVSKHHGRVGERAQVLNNLPVTSLGSLPDSVVVSGTRLHTTVGWKRAQVLHNMQLSECTAQPAFIAAHLGHRRLASHHARVGESTGTEQPTSDRVPQQT